MSERYPVTVAVTRQDGRVEHVRVGTATRTDEGFSLQLGDLAISSQPDRGAAAAPARRPAAAGGGGAPAGGMTLPNYGRSKGMPIHGASMQDLEYYANGARRSLNDPSKERWHARERELLAALEAEMARQRGEGGGEGGGGGGGYGGGGGGYGGQEPPPPGDDDIPF